MLKVINDFLMFLHGTKGNKIDIDISLLKEKVEKIERKMNNEKI